MYSSVPTFGAGHDFISAIGISSVKVDVYLQIRKCDLPLRRDHYHHRGWMQQCARPIPSAN